jgi:hypothetical protein
VPVGVDTRGHQGVHVDHPATFTDLQDEGVGGTNVYGPASRDRDRKSATCSSSSLAMWETCDLDRRVMPNVSTSFSIRRVLPRAGNRSRPRWSAPARPAGAAPAASRGSRTRHAAWGSLLPWSLRGCPTPGRAGTRCGS